ncbi:MAG: hypothetical protein LBT11_01610 [Treponema sp.]|jgi:hypothetical protein|nr:hypothetical protein [Treponema sp.]
MIKHRYKLIAPVIVTAALVLYCIGMAVTLLSFDFDIPGGFKLVLLLSPVIGIGFSLYVLIERIKEIRSGEEDDLSKY